MEGSTRSRGTEALAKDVALGNILGDRTRDPADSGCSSTTCTGDVIPDNACSPSKLVGKFLMFFSEIDRN